MLQTYIRFTYNMIIGNITGVMAKPALEACEG
jgi:hypothetical protein